MTKTGKGKPKTKYIIQRQEFDHLLNKLTADGFRLIGPTVRDDVLIYDDIKVTSDLPIGYTDQQAKGRYHLQKTETPTLFGCGLGPHSWKKFLYPSAVRLWQAHRQDGSFDVQPEMSEAEHLAFIGVRACELHAIAIQDRIFMGGAYVDPTYEARRKNIFIVAVNCGHAGSNCFCSSMHTGPKADAGYDLALTEVFGPQDHYFVVETGSEAGTEVLAAIPHRPASEEQIQAEDAVIRATTAQIERSVDTSSLKETLYASYDHPAWDSIAARCLACGNCTMVCPTCFCTTVEDTTDLTGATAERWRKWDSCFTMDFSYIVGGSIRASVKSRYRQWLTHKFATWIDQFGSSGCVGCGRCITWCPVGIDITDEIRAIDGVPVKPEFSRGGGKKHENA